MFNYDFHIHTELCGHAPGQTVGKILAKADELGLKAIAITEHISKAEDMEIIDIIRSEVQRYHTNCRVLVGTEVDADRHRFDGRLVLDKRPDLDYVIGTIHYLPGTDVIPHCNPARPIGPEETFNRWRSTLLGLVSNPIIDTLAHPAAMIANVLNEDDFSQRVLDTFAESAEISVKNSIAWELNDHTRNKLTETQQQQYYKILQLAIDAGVRLVYGSDAHCPENIGSTVFVSKVLSKLVGESGIEKPLALGLK